MRPPRALRQSQGFRSPLGDRVFDVFNAVLLLALVLITLYPFYYVLMASLSEPSRMLRHSGVLLAPQGFSLEAYVRVFENSYLRESYRNTVLYTVFGTALNIVLTCLGAYGLSKHDLVGRTPITLFIVLTMFFSGGLIPNFLLVQSLGLLNNPLAVILPTAVNTWNLLILRTAFAAIPPSLEESARLEGANDLIILCRIYIPLSLPTLAVLVLFYAVGHWNSWFSALIYLNDPHLHPLQLALRQILIDGSTEGVGAGGDAAEPVAVTLRYAAIVASILPILLVYPFLQRYFVKGVLVGGVKE
ncbi:carbohydrate ABC transporter permease [Deinococcus sp.]|uniref:carbohydrate ABC transporter permease n=1 Tax=Deinococcus sp. TaxID=47478 RepID=UPI0025D989E2|nr:carbohydrate ABC transporter permease [Deinococcus sp.]